MPAFTIQVDCKPAEVAEIKALLEKYTFLADGVRQIDGYMTKRNVFITPHIEKMVRKNK